MNKQVISLLSILFIGLLAFQTASAQETPEYSYQIDVAGTSFTPSTIYAGDVINLEVSIKNRSSEAQLSDVEAELDLGDQFKEIKVADSVGFIRPSETKTFVFEFQAELGISPGYYSVPLTITYLSGKDSFKQSHVVLVPVLETEKNLDITIDPNVVNPGKPTEVVFTIKNVGSTPVSNISLSWTEEENLVLPLGSDNKRYVSVLTAEQETTVSYLVTADPNITPGIYPLDVTVTFNDIDAVRTQTSHVGLIVGGKTEFEVSAELLSSGQVSISIANIGSNNAGAVVVRVPEQSGVTVSGSNASILGNLNKGDFTLANFELRTTGFQRPSASDTTVPDEDSGRRTILVQIDYTDTTGERQSVQKQLEMNFVSSSETETTATGFAGRQRTASQDNAVIVWALLAVLIVGAAAYNRFRAGNRSWKKLGKILVPVILLFLAVAFLLGSNTIAAVVAAIVSVLLLGWFFRERHVMMLLEKAAGQAKKYLE